MNTWRKFQFFKIIGVSLLADIDFSRFKKNVCEIFNFFYFKSKYTIYISRHNKYI